MKVGTKNFKFVFLQRMCTKCWGKKELDWVEFAKGVDPLKGVKRGTDDTGPW